MRITVLTSVHRITDTRIFHKECLSLVAMGHDVTLIAPTTADREIRGVRILHVHRRHSRLARFTLSLGEILYRALRLRTDIYHLHDPELIPLGLILKLRGSKVILDVHEDFPAQIISKQWLPVRSRLWVARVAAKVESLGARFLDRVIVAEPPVAKKFPGSVVVQNYPLLSEAQQNQASGIGTHKATFCYVGGITGIRGIHEMLAAADALQNYPGFTLALGGVVHPPGLQGTINQGNRPYVEILGLLDRSEVVRLYSRSVAGLAVLHPVPNYVDAQATKIFEYMSAGLPVICSNFPLWSRIVEGSQCGLVVDPLNVDDITEAMRWVLANKTDAVEMGQRGREKILRSWNWASEAQKLRNVYESLR